MTLDALNSLLLRRRLVLIMPLCGLAASGCANDREKIDAIGALNEGFRSEYEKLLAEKGTRVFRVNRSDAFVAMRVALASLGMRTEQQDLTLGHLAVAASAPLPLTEDEWRTASQADLPLLRRLIAPHVGAAANFVQFEPQGLDVVINASFLDAPTGTEVALTVRLREVAAARSGWPRREYVSPHVLTVGLEKIFATFDRELRAAARR
ncbi:MAG: hypothetical protein ABI520_12260 [Caldimonas sp.]